MTATRFDVPAQAVAQCGRCHGPVYLGAAGFEHACRGSSAAAPAEQPTLAQDRRTQPVPALPMEPIRFTVLGQPRPKGSLTGAADDAGKVHMRQDPKLRAWMKAIRKAVAPHRPPMPWDFAVRCDIVFFLHRGKTVKREWPTVPPDKDKLERAVFDALTKARVWKDDSRAVIGLVEKRYADDGKGPRVEVTLTPVGGA